MIKLVSYEDQVKKLYPNAIYHSFQLNNWPLQYCIGKENKKFTDCEEDDDFIDPTTSFSSELMAWESTYNKLKEK